MSKISFKNWLLSLDELYRDPSLLPTNNVKLSELPRHGYADDPISNNGYQSKFKIGNEDFLVDITRSNEYYANTPLEGVFDISFEGPSGLSLAKNNSGVDARNKYNHLLASIAKMINQEESQGRSVNGFAFHGAEAAMNLMYQKFYKTYLQPAGYLRVGYNLYLKKDYIRQILSKLPDFQKKQYLNDIVKANDRAKSDLNKISIEKAEERKNLMTLDKYQGKFVYFFKSASTTPSIGYIFGKSPSRYTPIMLASLSGSPARRYAEIEYTSLRNITSGTPTHDEIVALLTAVSNSSSILNRINNIRPLLNQYNIVSGAGAPNLD